MLPGKREEEDNAWFASTGQADATAAGGVVGRGDWEDLRAGATYEAGPEREPRWE